MSVLTDAKISNPLFVNASTGAQLFSFAKTPTGTFCRLFLTTDDTDDSE